MVLARLSIVPRILLHTFLAVAARLVASLAGSCSSLSRILRCLVELDLSILIHERMRALRLWRDIVGKVVVNLSSLSILIILFFGTAHAIRADTMPVAARLGSGACIYLIMVSACSLA